MTLKITKIQVCHDHYTAELGLNPVSLHYWTIDTLQHWAYVGAYAAVLYSMDVYFLYQWSTDYTPKYQGLVFIIPCVGTYCWCLRFLDWSFYFDLWVFHIFVFNIIIPWHYMLIVNLWRLFFCGLGCLLLLFLFCSPLTSLWCCIRNNSTSLFIWCFNLCFPLMPKSIFCLRTRSFGWCLLFSF